MKKIHVILLFTLCVVVSSCFTSYISTKQVMGIHQGMSQREVETVLGKPDYRRFDGRMEEWEFHRDNGTPGFTSIPMTVSVQFIGNEVVSMDTFKGYGRRHPTHPIVMSPSIVVAKAVSSPDQRLGNNGYTHLRAMSSADFDRFLREFKNEPFESGRTEMLDEVVSPSGFTCEQSRKLVELYTFETEKKNMIKKLYPKIDDKRNFSILTDIFTFEMDKREMREFAESYDSRRN